MFSTWVEDSKRFDRETMPKLRRYGKDIGTAADGSGQDKAVAMEIIRCYGLLRRSFDPVTCLLLEESLDKFIQNREQSGDTVCVDSIVR